MPRLGKTGPFVPPIIFGTSALGNLYAAHPKERKLAVLREIFRESRGPVVLDSAGKYGAGLALETIGRGLRTLGVPADQVLVSNKLGWLRVPLRGPEPTFEPGVWAGLQHDAEQAVSYEGILRCWEQGCALLGPPFRPALVSVHDPDELLARARTPGERDRAKQQLLDAYRALHELKQRGEVGFVGVGAKDWTVIRELVDEVALDWVMLACSLTILRHPEDVVGFVDRLQRQGIGVVNSAVFHAGFLTGGEFFDYRRLDPVSPGDRPLFDWRERFHAVCRAHDVSPAVACVRFALSHPAVACVALNTSRPEQVRGNVAMGEAWLPSRFWSALKDAGLIRREYPHVGGA
jgi:D-threo-aldose 1-dehydrogenase